MTTMILNFLCRHLIALSSASIASAAMSMMVMTTMMLLLLTMNNHGGVGVVSAAETPDKYDLYEGLCINGNNIEMIKDQTVDQCATLCNAKLDCVGFEYGHDVKDCQLSDMACYDGNECFCPVVCLVLIVMGMGIIRTSTLNL